MILKMEFYHRTRLVFVCLLIFLVHLAVASAHGASTDPAIESITVAADPGVAEKVTIRLNASHSPKTFRIDGERPRLVLDFLAVRSLFDKSRIDGAGGSIVAGVRVGRHNDPLKTRVVVDIVDGASYQYDYTFNVSDKSLVIVFQPQDPQDQQVSKPHRISAAQAKIVHQADAAADTPIVSDTAEEDKQITAEEKVEPAEKSPEREETVKPEEQPPAQPRVEQPAQPSEVVVPDVTQKEQENTSEAEPEPSPAPEQTPAAAKTQEPVPEQSPETAAAGADKGDDAEVVQAASPEQGEGEVPVILDVSFEESINNSETVLFKLSHFSPPLVFGIEKGTPRVVCDFINGEVKPEVPEAIEAGGKYVHRITVNKLTDPKKIRVELELVANRHYDLQQLFFKEDNLFVVIVNELPE